MAFAGRIIGTMYYYSTGFGKGWTDCLFALCFSLFCIVRFLFLSLFRCFINISTTTATVSL